MTEAAVLSYPRQPGTSAGNSPPGRPDSDLSHHAGDILLVLGREVGGDLHQHCWLVRPLQGIPLLQHLGYKGQRWGPQTTAQQGTHNLQLQTKACNFSFSGSPALSYPQSTSDGSHSVLWNWHRLLSQGCTDFCP